MFLPRGRILTTRRSSRGRKHALGAAGRGMMSVVPRIRLLLVILLLVIFRLAIGAAPGLEAAEWGTISPGESTREDVRARYGEPTRSSPLKIEGYDALQWEYEGDRAPGGMRRMTLEFGLLTDAGYRPEVVRIMRLEPKANIFTRGTVLMGWGAPTTVGQEGETPIFFYQSGLLVEFDKEGWIALRMTFTPPQGEREQ
jgi:hypothetical protein